MLYFRHCKNSIHNRLDCILNKAVLYAEKIKHQPVFEAKEPWRVAVMLIYLACIKCGLWIRLKDISNATGVSSSYLSSNYKECANVLSCQKQI